MQGTLVHLVGLRRREQWGGMISIIAVSWLLMFLFELLTGLGCPLDCPMDKHDECFR